MCCFTGAVKADKSNKQLLDKLQVERERGITVKVCQISQFITEDGDFISSISYMKQLATCMILRSHGQIGRRRLLA